MKVLVYSDSHGYKNKVVAMLERESDSDFCFFLGDGMREAEEVTAVYPKIKFILVKGNNDFYSDREKIAYKHIDGLTFVACHGDDVNVRYGLYDLIEKTRSVRGHIALYGHTHLRNTYNDISSGVLALNPGAMCEGQYAVITTDKGKFDIEMKLI